MMKEVSLSLKSHFLRLYRMAICDDVFSELELKMLYEFAKTRNIPTEEVDKILLNPINGMEGVPDTLELKIEYLYDLTQMIWADNQVTDDEKSLLKKYIKIFGFVDENISTISDYLIESVKKNKPLSQIIQEII